MRTLHAEILVAELGARRRGIVPVDAVVGLGVGDRQLVALRRRGVLVPVGRGVDRLRDRPFDWESRCQAALDLAGDGAVLGLRSAARVEQWYSYRAADDVEVLVERGRDQRTSVGRVVQTRFLPAEHRAVVDGFPVTTPARTYFDLCGDPDPGIRYRSEYHRRRMWRVYNDAVGRRGLTFVQEAAVLAVTARRGRRGTRLARETLLRFGPEHEPTRSDTEYLFLELVTARGLPEPKRQLAISGPDGFIGVVDFCWPEHRVVVEVDSSWHDGPLDVEEDRRRDERLRAAGYRVERVRYGEMIRDPAGVLRKLGVATSK